MLDCHAAFVDFLNQQANDLEPPARLAAPAIGDALDALASAKGSLLARSHLLKTGLSLAVARVDVHDSAGNLIATALITYMYVGRRSSSVS